MKALISLSLIGSIVLAGCSTATDTNVAVTNSAKANASKPAATPAVHQDEGHDAPRISLADAKKAFDEKTAVFIDTHPPNQFEIEHITGAINIQPNTIKQNLEKVPKGKKIIVYCS